MNYRRELQVGVIFIVGLVLLIIFSITVSQLEIFRPFYYYTVIFDEISGLKKNDPVRVSGMDMGSVASLEHLPNTKIKVVLKLHEPIKLYEKCEVRIEESSLLGGNFVGIYQGSPDRPELPPGTILKGKITLSGIDRLGEFVVDNQEDVKNFLKGGIEIVRKVQEGQGSLGRLINDDALYNNLKSTSEDLKKITEQIKEGKGPLGKLLFDEKLSEQVTQAGDAAAKILAPVVMTQVFTGVDGKYFAESQETISRIYLKIFPHDRRYFLVGATLLSLDKEGIIDFENQQKDNENQSFVKAELQLAYTFPLDADHRFTFRPGLLEGKLGAGLDWEIPVTATGLFPINITLEGRDAFNSVTDENIDENLSGGMYRAYTTLNINRYIQVYLGANRLFDEDVEFMGGLCFTYPDNDIKNFVVLLGLSR